MVQERLGRDVENNVLQLLQVTHPGHFFQRMRIAEDEISEPEVVGHNVAQVHIHLLGILVHKAGCIPAHIVPVFHLGRLENQRHERVLLAYFRHQLDTRHRVHNTFPRITGIRNHSQYVLAIPII